MLVKCHRQSIVFADSVEWPGYAWAYTILPPDIHVQLVPLGNGSSNVHVHCAYLRYFFEGDFKRRFVVDVKSEQRPPEPWFPPVPSLHTQVYLSQLLVKLALEEILQFRIILYKLYERT